jgi:hypothetical protein
MYLTQRKTWFDTEKNLVLGIPFFAYLAGLKFAVAN